MSYDSIAVEDAVTDYSPPGVDKGISDYAYDGGPAPSAETPLGNVESGYDADEGIGASGGGKVVDY